MKMFRENHRVNFDGHESGLWTAWLGERDRPGRGGTRLAARCFSGYLDSIYLRVNGVEPCRVPKAGRRGMCLAGRQTLRAGRPRSPGLPSSARIW